MYRYLLLLLLLCAAPAWTQSCSHHLLVSGYFSTVHVYDACTGAFVKELDSRTRLEGAQAIRVGPDGFIYVVAEGKSVIRKYDPLTLAHVGIHVVAPAGMAPLGLDFASDGTAYVAGYNSNDVKKFDANGALIGPAFAARASGINGPEIGTTFGPDGNLYVPGYNSNTVIRFDPRTGQTSVAIAARAGGISQPRGLLLDRDRQHFFLIAEGSGQIMRWNIATGALTEFKRGLIGPTMAAFAPDGKLLVATSDSVVRLDPVTGATLGTLVPSGSGGLSGSTFLAVVPNLAVTPTVDASQIGSQFWVVGDDEFVGRILELEDVFSATGTGFGSNLDFNQLRVHRWGSVSIELLSCTRARFSWNSTGPFSANFGSGSYELQRFFSNEATARCLVDGIDAADHSWVTGQWWGGEGRSGEGIFLDRRGDDDTTFFSWFTHRPAANATPAPDAQQLGSQYWVVSTATLDNQVLAFNDVFSATGTVFGPNLRFSDLSVKRWGAIRVEFLSCTRARFSWDSTGANSANFGSGSYEVERFFSNEATTRCEQQGFQGPDKSWMNGQWWGGEARAGEGWFLDRRSDGTTFLAWFTHRPR